jgi:excisionase family DNA binding protein
MVDWERRKGKPHSVDDLLTTKQLQDLLQVDRITIYRMLNDGRLRGFKVGGQWRFSRQEIEGWLQEQQAGLDEAQIVAPPAGSITSSPETLPLSCIQAIQSVCAEALGIAAVTTDLEGKPLADISNSCKFCSLVLSTGEGRRRCAAAWKLANEQRVHTCHAGLLCVTAPIEVSQQLVAISVGCQFAVQPAGTTVQGWENNLGALAHELGLGESDLRATAGSVRIIPEGELPRIVRLLLRVASTFSEIGEERLSLLSRLQHIAEMSRI